MADLRQVKEYLNSKNEMISNIDEIWERFQIPIDDYKTRWQVLEIIAQKQNIYLMKKAKDVSHHEESARIIAEKLKSQTPGFVDAPYCEIAVPRVKSPAISDENVQMYLDLIKGGISLEDIIKDISSRKDASDIIAKILLNYIEEIKIYNELLKEGLSEEIKTEIDRIKELVNRIKLLSSIQAIEDAEEENTFLANYKVIFFRTAVGNNDFLSDLEKLDESDYNNFIILFKSILDGNMVSYRKLVKFKGMKEVRYSNCRIAFIFEGSYCVILSAFVKKSDIVMSTYNTILKRISRFHLVKKQLISEYEEEAIRQESLEILNFLEDNKRMCKK